MTDHFWDPGDNVVLRGMYEDTIVTVQSLRVVKDTPCETALFICPGAECLAPGAYIRQGHDWKERWRETLDNKLMLEKFIWHTKSFLILLEPEKFYSTIYMWNATSNQFLCYYINFQLPFRRTPLGFDSLDLDLDLVIFPSFDWEWKDESEYRDAVRLGGIRPQWVGGVEKAKVEILERLEKRIYPLDSSWLDFQPDPGWMLPYLPGDWNKVFSVDRSV